MNIEREEILDKLIQSQNHHLVKFITGILGDAGKVTFYLLFSAIIYVKRELMIRILSPLILKRMNRSRYAIRLFLESTSENSSRMMDKVYMFSLTKSSL